MRIADIERVKQELEDSNPIIIDYFEYDKESKTYKIEWIENDKYMEVNELKVGEAEGKYEAKTIIEVKEYINGLYDKNDLHLY